MRNDTNSKLKLLAPPAQNPDGAHVSLTPLQERIIEWDREYLRQTKRLASIIARARRRLRRHDHLF